LADIPNPDTLVIVTIGDAETLDPANAYDSASGDAQYQVYDCLLEYVGGSLSEYAPRLVTIVPTIDNGLVSPLEGGGYLVSMQLRDGVTFQNGNALTPSDVEYTFERFQVTDSAGGPQWMLFNAFYGFDFNVLEDLIDEYGEDGAKQKIQDSVAVVGDAVVFKIAISPALFYDSIAAQGAYWGGILDEEWCIENGCWPQTWDIELGTDYRIGADASSSPIYNIANGTGPYKVIEWRPLEEMRFEAYADFWGGWEGNHVQNVVIKSVDEWGTRKLMFEQGDADICYVPRQYRDQMTGTAGVRTVYGYPILSNSAMMFMGGISPDSTMIGSGQLDGQGIPPDFFSDVNVRKAFSYCFDWDVYTTQAWLGEASQAWSCIPSSLPGVLKDEDYRYHLDLEKAEEYFRLAWNGEVWEKGFKMTLEYNLGNDQRKTASEILEMSIESLNPKFQIDVLGLDWPTHLAAQRAHQQAMHVTGWGADYGNIYNFAYPYYHSLGTFMQFQLLGIDAMDALLLEAVNTGSAETYAEIQKLAYDLAPNIPLVDANGRRWERTWVHGRYVHPTGPNYTFYTIWKAEEGPGHTIDLVNYPDMLVEEWQ
jgi:peptide/nickel transport system substrate-binding protein